MKATPIFLLLAACAVPVDDAATGEVEQDVDSYNGTSLNGTSLNGTSLNGTSLNGTSLNGTSLNGTSLNGTSLNGTSLNGTSLNGTSTVGSTWSGTASNGATVQLRIDSAAQGTAPNDDVWFYGVSYQTSGGWSPLCVDATGAPVQAIAVAGVWTGTSLTYAASTSQFTWACRFKTVAKCVELGYKTWQGYADQMASCVRLLRADYCGDGASYTHDGTLLNLYDNVGVQADTESWTLEAGWSPSGAMCIDRGGDTRFALLGITTPSCYKSLRAKACSFATPGVLLLDELSPTTGTTTTGTTTTMTQASKL
jgi:hypothetical protein